jgi:hypothetical protein
MDVAEVTHGEFRVERANDGVKERGGVGGEYDVIHIE